MNIIGRWKEQQKFKEILAENKSAFIALYGRRRVGKTYLVREYFHNSFTFSVTGMANTTTKYQLLNFDMELKRCGHQDTQISQNWLEAFQSLVTLVEQSTEKQKVIFIDEMPWMDTMHSHFLSGLEHFWNSWASSRKDIILIVCGSAASWMINKLINNTGGLHNRVTHKMKIEPFTLHETECYLQSKGIIWDRYQLITTYMVTGGIPFYLDGIKKEQSAIQNINSLCFSMDGRLKNEFKNLYASLFKKHKKHVAIVQTLSTKKQGLTREEIISGAKLSNGGTITTILEELEECGFIRRYTPIGRKSRRSIYQLVDFYTLFYFQFIKDTPVQNDQYWLQMIDHPRYRAWSGYAFELVGLMHSQEIKQALGISGIQSNVHAWRSKKVKGGAQVDLLIDRRDQVINLFEMKFSIHPFEINANYADQLRNKIGTFKTETKTKKAVYLSFLTTYGIQNNAYSGMVQNSLTMDALFGN